MKICMISKNTTERGGMEKHTSDLIKGLRKRGHEVVNFVNKNPASIKSLVTYDHFDIVHSQSLAGYPVLNYCREKHIPFVITVHGTPLNSLKSAWNARSFWGLFNSLDRFGDKYLAFGDGLRYANATITVSTELYQDVIKQYPRCRNPRIVYNGVDTDFFAPMEQSIVREDWPWMWVKKSDKIIFTCGRHVKAKGIQHLIRIMPKLEKRCDVKLIIAGDGPYSEKLMKLNSEKIKSRNIFFAGHREDSEMPQLYNMADVVVFPTLQMEGLPLAVLEAMSCGKNVVASQIGGVPTAIKDCENGYLVLPKDEGTLIDTLTCILGSYTPSNKVGEAARKTVLNQFTLDKMVDDTLQVYRGAMLQ
jgi:glycosyltransferase involved in cell wall biosynthesis